MRHSDYRRIRQQRFMLVLMCLFILLSVLSAGVSRAATIPGFEQSVELSVREQPVPAFIETLFARIGVPVVMETEVPGRVNGRFTGSAEDVFTQIGNTFNLHVYYDNALAHVYRSNQVGQQLLGLSELHSERLIKAAEFMQLPDSRNALRVIPGGGVQVTGNRRFIEQIEDLSLAVQRHVKSSSPSKAGNKARPVASAAVTVREFRLKYASADDVSLVIGGTTVDIPGVATMLREFINQDKSHSSVTLSRRPVDASIAGNLLADDALAGDARVGDRQSSRHGTPEPGAQPSGSTTVRGPRGHISIVAHPQTNSVWIQDTLERMPIYENMVASMDVEPLMVEIEATIIDINNQRQRELGINWRAVDGDDEVLFGNGTVDDQRLRPGQIITPQGNGGIVSVVLGDRAQFIARLRALEEVGAARIVSKPHVITMSNVEAVLGSTTEFFVRLEGREAVGLERQSFGTVLRVTPRVFDRARGRGINLLITIEDGSATEGEVDRIPGIERTVVSTQALIGEGQSLLLGGLVRESFRHGESKVPLLGDIPGLGRLFKSDTRNKTRTERLFLITPRVTNLGSVAGAATGPVLQGDADTIIRTSAHRMDGTLAAIGDRAPVDTPATTPVVVEPPASRWRVRDWSELDANWQAVGG